MNKIILTILLSLFTFSAFAQNVRTKFDFDGDGKADISVFRPSDGVWYVLKSSGGYSFTKWGLATDEQVPGDYDGDGRTDVAVYRYGALGPNGTGSADNTWYILRSSDNTFLIRQWGRTAAFQSDIPAPADYDGDGKTDLAVYNEEDVGAPSYFKILQSSTNSGIEIGWGDTFDKRVPADFDGDGKADLAIYRTWNGEWWYLRSSDGRYRVLRFGNPTDSPVPADYTGDGKADIAVWRPPTGEWFVLRSEDNSYYSVAFGKTGDLPVPADYDGDGKTDLAVWRKSDGIWYINKSSGGFLIAPFGAAGDKPVPSAIIP